MLFIDIRKAPTIVYMELESPFLCSVNLVVVSYTTTTVHAMGEDENRIFQAHFHIHNALLVNEYSTAQCGISKELYMANRKALVIDIVVIS